MHRRTPSAGAVVSDFSEQLAVAPRLPPRSTSTTTSGRRTPITCPASPLVGFGHATTSTSGAWSSCSSRPRRPPPRSVSCECLAPDVTPPHLLPNVVTTVFESNITAAQCYAAYGRTPPGVHAQMLAAPPLSGGHSGARAGLGSRTHDQRLLHPKAADAAVAPGGQAHSSHVSSSMLANDINDVDFGLAACLATPMDPGSGLERRLVPLPATTTAARTAAIKLGANNDLLQDASRAGEWARRTRRRRKLEAAAGLLGAIGSAATRGRLLDDDREGEAAAGAGQPDDTLLAHEAGPSHDLHGGSSGGTGSSRSRRADPADAVAAVSAACALAEAGEQEEELLAGELAMAGEGEGERELNASYDASDDEATELYGDPQGLFLEPEFLGFA